MQDASNLPAPDESAASPSNEGTQQAPSAPAEAIPEVLPFSITSAVFQALRGAPSAYSNMGLSHSYPAGSFEAIEALTFVTEPSWQKALVQEVTKRYFRDLWVLITQGYIQNAVEGKRVAPPTRNLLFNAFNLTPLEKIKVAIICPGPIIGEHCNSDGLAWSTHPASSKLPNCTSHLFQLLKRYDPDFQPPHHGSLRHWAEQGVFLLNLALVSCSQSHGKNVFSHGWGSLVTSPESGPRSDMLMQFAPFWRGVLGLLKTRCRHLVLLLFWDHSLTSQYVHAKVGETLAGQENVWVVYGQSLTAENADSGFDCFREVNNALAKFGEEAVNWTDLGASVSSA